MSCAERNAVKQGDKLAVGRLRLKPVSYPLERGEISLGMKNGIDRAAHRTSGNTFARGWEQGSGKNLACGGDDKKNPGKRKSDFARMDRAHGISQDSLSVWGTRPSEKKKKAGVPKTNRKKCVEWPVWGYDTPATHGFSCWKGNTDISATWAEREMKKTGKEVKIGSLESSWGTKTQETDSESEVRVTATTFIRSAGW